MGGRISKFGFDCAGGLCSSCVSCLGSSYNRCKDCFSKQGISSSNCMHDRLMNVVIIISLFIYIYCQLCKNKDFQSIKFPQTNGIIKLLKLNFCIDQEQMSTC